MTEQALITRIRSENTRSATSMKNYLKLFVESIDLMASDAGDWTCLSELIGNSRPAVQGILRPLAGRVVIGWRVIKDDKVQGGIRFRRVADRNQGFDMDILETLRGWAETGMTLDNKRVKDLSKDPEKEAKKSSVTVEDAADHIWKYLKRHDDLSSGAVLSIIQKKIQQAV